jgi:CarD family transcriptional regulator
MPSNKKTAKSHKTPASGGVRGKTEKIEAKSAASSRSTGQRTRQSKTTSARAGSAAKADAAGGAASNRTAAAKVGRASTAKSAAKKTAAAKSVSVKSSSVKSASVRELAAKNAAAKSAAARAAAEKVAQAKDAARAKTAAAKSSVTKSSKAGPVAKASAAKDAAVKTSVNVVTAEIAVPAKMKANASDAVLKKSIVVKPVEVQEANKSARIAAPETIVPKKAEKPTPPPIAPQATEAVIAAAAAKRPATSEAMANKSPEKTFDKPAGAKISAPPAAPLAQAPAALTIGEAKPAAPQQPATATRPVPAAKSKPSSHKLGFKLNEFIVYPAHGVGQITAIEVQEVAGFSLELFVVSFIKDKMILKVPTSKVASVGMRKLAEADVVEKALSTLSGRARVKRTMWSRRAQEYEAKINSGDLVTISEVVRDLYRSDSQPEQSYSERQLYEAALDRMAREISAVRKLIDSEALKLIETFLLKGPKRGQKTEADSGDDGDDTDVVQAA